MTMGTIIPTTTTTTTTTDPSTTGSLDVSTRTP
jgi:hypothetical protein